MLFIITLISIVAIIYFAADGGNHTVAKRIVFSAALVVVTIASFMGGLFFFKTDFSTPVCEKEYELVSVGTNSHASGKGNFVYSSFKEEEVYNLYAVEGDGYRLLSIPANATIVYETEENLNEAKLVVYNCEQPWYVDFTTFWFFGYPNPETRYELQIPKGSLSREISLEP